MTPINPSALPSKEDLPKDLWGVATTLSEDMQELARRKAREFGFDLKKGRISLDETLINLSRDRDTIIDAVEKEKLVQLPLKVQFVLYVQAQKVSEALTALGNGTDTTVVLEEAVDDLTATIWQYNLHNLSREVLGFQSKMNQLKSQEILINRVHKAALEFEGSSAHARELLASLEQTVSGSQEQARAIPAAVEQVSALLAKAGEHEQAIAGLVIRAQQSDTAAAQHEANAKTANADVQAFVNRLPEIQTEIQDAKTRLTALNSTASDLLTTVKNQADDAIVLVSKDSEKLAEATTALSAELKAKTEELTSATKGELDQMQSDQNRQIKTLLDNANTESGRALEKFAADATSAISAAKTSFDDYATNSEKEQRRLVTALEELEAQIRESICGGPQFLDKKDPLP
jgi:hypothetical protein